MRKLMRSVMVVAVSFTISFLAGWAYLSWDSYPKEFPEITDSPVEPMPPTMPVVSDPPPETPPAPESDPPPEESTTPGGFPTRTEITACALPEDYSEYGLLIGLADDEGGHRTLWIRPQQGELLCAVIPGAVVFPVGEGFGWLMNVTGEIASSSNRTLTLSKLLYGALGEDLSGLTGGLADAQNYWEDGADSFDALYYVGDEYVCYINQFYTGGSSDVWYREYARTITLESVNHFSPHEADPRENEDGELSAYVQEGQIDLGELLDNDLLRSLGTLSEFAYGFESRTAPDFRSLTIAHSRGRWHVSAPLLRRHYNSGNNSRSLSFERLFPLSVPLPESMTGFHDWPEDMEYSLLLWSESITDAVASPDFGAFAALSARTIDVLGRDGRPDTPLLTLSSRMGERIVSVRWAGAADIQSWEETLSPFFAEGGSQ